MATGLPSLLQAFFTDRLLRQQRASPNTIAGYRDSFRLLFHFAKDQLRKAPSNLAIEDLNVSFIGDFLDHLENRRKNSARTRNIRLAAIHSFFQYVAFEEPAHALLCQRILAMPTKRHERPGDRGDKMKKHRGCIQISRRKKWLLRWRETVLVDGAKKRVMRYKPLGDVTAEQRRNKDRKTGKLRIPDEIQLLADAVIEPVLSAPPTSVLTTIGDFVTDYLKDREAELKVHTCKSYYNIWERYLMGWTHWLRQTAKTLVTVSYRLWGQQVGD